MGFHLVLMPVCHCSKTHSFNLGATVPLKTIHLWKDNLSSQCSLYCVWWRFSQRMLLLFKLLPSAVEFLGKVVGKMQTKEKQACIAQLLDLGH